MYIAVIGFFPVISYSMQLCTEYWCHCTYNADRPGLSLVSSEASKMGSAVFSDLHHATYDSFADLIGLAGLDASQIEADIPESHRGEEEWATVGGTSFKWKWGPSYLRQSVHQTTFLPYWFSPSCSAFIRDEDLRRVCLCGWNFYTRESTALLTDCAAETAAMVIFLTEAMKQSFTEWVMMMEPDAQ